MAQSRRDPGIVPISLVSFSRPKPARIERYADVDVARAVVMVPSNSLVDADFVLGDLDATTSVLQSYADR